MGRAVALIRERDGSTLVPLDAEPLDAPVSNGATDVVLVLLVGVRDAVWLYEVDRGATNYWETWTAISLNGQICATVQRLRAGKRRRRAGRCTLQSRQIALATVLLWSNWTSMRAWTKWRGAPCTPSPTGLA